MDRLRGAIGQRRGQGAEPAVDGLGDGFRAAVEGLFQRLEAAFDRVVEEPDFAVERTVETGDAGAERGLELHQTLIERGRDGSAIGVEPAVEGVDIVLQAVGDVLGAFAHALDDLPAEGLDGAVELGNVTCDQRAERAAVAGKSLGKLAALALHQLVEGAHLQAERVVGVLGLADDLGHQRVYRHVQRVARLVAAGKYVGGEPVAGVVDLAHQVAAAQLELEQQRIAGILQGVVQLLGAIGDRVDDAVGALLEVAGDAVDPLVQKFVDPVGQVDELVMDVPGLEVEARGEAFAGVEHRAGGFRAGLLEPVEQVAAALAERQDHVVAGIAEGAGDVGAALLQRAGDALGDLVDAGCDRVRDQGDVVPKVDLHPRDGAADLLGLTDQIVALMCDVLQQRANADLVVAVGALECRDLIGNQGLEFAGPRDRAFDAVAHRGHLASDGLADRHHGIACRVLGFREADRDLRHRLRDHAQFLTAPGQTGEEIDQQHRRDEQRR